MMEKIILICVFAFYTMLTFSQNSDFDLGVALFNENKFGQAKLYFEKVLIKNTEDKKAQEYLGDISGYQKQWDIALVIYKKLIDSDENNANYHFKYGGVLALKAQASNKLKALTLVSSFKKHLHKAAELDHRHIEVRWALVEIYVSLPSLVGGSESKANLYANELLKLSPVDGYLSLGYVAEYYNNPTEAEQYYKKAIAIGGSMNTYSKLSGLYEKTDQPKKAIGAYENTQEKYQRNQLNYQIGKVCAQYNLELDKGLACLEVYLKNYSAKDGVPKSWANFRIAQIYRHKKDKRNAFNYIQKAIAEKPDLEFALNEKKLILMM